jgi:excisionase family DNA binding protein
MQGKYISRPGRHAAQDITRRATDLAAQLGEVAEEQARLQAILLHIAQLLPDVPLQQEPRPTDVPGFFTVAEVAGLLKVDRTTIYTWMDHRGLPFQYVGTRRRVRRDALERWMAQQAEAGRV